jgi:hypothetical protein
LIKAQFYFQKDGYWCTDFRKPVLIKKPNIGDDLDYNGKVFQVIDIDAEYDIYDIYLD